jgi:Mn-dependent DtxR family transcriptional regulator
MMSGKDAKSDKLFSWFPSKHFLRFPILLTKNQIDQACPLPVEDRVMYAYLASHTAQGETVSLSEIARDTGLNRTSSVLNARDRLLGLGLLYYRKHQNIALEPADWVRDFFRFPEKLSGATEWTSRYQYCWYIPAGRSIPVISQAVYWLLWSYGDGSTVPICQAGLAVQLGVTAKTIKKSLGNLEDAGLIRLYSDGKLTAGFLRPSVEMLEMFSNRVDAVGESSDATNHCSELPGVVYPGNTQAKTPEVQVSKDVATEPIVSEVDHEDAENRAIQAAMKGIKLSTEEVDLINNFKNRGFMPGDMRICIDIYKELGKLRFATLFNEASREHKRNKNDEQRGDCFALFRWKVQAHMGNLGTSSQR